MNLRDYIRLSPFLLLFVASPANSWSYNEHFRITHDAFGLACDEIKAENPKSLKSESVSAMCNHRLFKACVSHMVAISGDVLLKPEHFLEPRFRGYLKRKGKSETQKLDCSNLDSIIKMDSSAGDLMAIDGLAYPLGSSYRRFIQVANHASTNTSHFMPEAKEKWGEYFRKSIELASKETVTLGEIFSNHAMSLHFLEDAYSAGHNGLDRGNLWQDYDQAYHDDINHTGIFLTDGISKWHTYGDRFLDKKSLVYVGEESTLKHIFKVVSEESPEIFSISLSETEEQNLDKRFSTNLEDTIVLSISKTGKGKRFFSLCDIDSSCDKEEIILSDVDLNISNGPCEPAMGNTIIYECTYSRHYVTTQAKRSLKAILSTYSGMKTDSLIREIEMHFPSAYYALKQDENSYEHNTNTLLLRYSNNATGYTNNGQRTNTQLSGHKFLEIMKWGASIDTKNSESSMIDETSLYWNIFGHFGGYKSIRLENKWEVLNSKGRFLDGFDASLFTPSLRTPRNIVGTYAKVSVGIDNLWDSDSRNAYTGFGIGIDLHLGRKILYLEFDKLNHFRSSDSSFDSERILFGFRSTAINLN